MTSTDTIDTALDALVEDGFVNASLTNLGGNVMGVEIPWDETTVLVTEDGGFLVGIYATEGDGEPTALHEVQTVAEVVATVNTALGIED